MATTSIHDIETSALECVRLDVKHGNLDIHDDEAVDTYCHQSADGHHDVIYTYAVRELFANGDLDDYLGEVDWSGPFTPDTDIDRMLTIAAYWAVRHVFSDAVETVREDMAMV